MKKIILRLLWLDDDQIKRKGRIFGWICIAGGIVLIIGGVFFFLYLNQSTKTIEEKTENHIIALTTDSELVPLENKNVENAIITLSAYLNFLWWIRLPLVLFVWAFGLSSIFWGCLYFVAYKALNMNPHPKH